MKRFTDQDPALSGDAMPIAYPNRPRSPETRRIGEIG
jgi:hypothetical protein